MKNSIIVFQLTVVPFCIKCLGQKTLSCLGEDEPATIVIFASLFALITELPEACLPALFVHDSR
jgi:hypothetical protein